MFYLNSTNGKKQYQSGNHEAIIDPETFEMVQRELARRTKQQNGEITAFSEKLWCGLLDYATAYADGRLTFTFKNGSTFES